MTKLRKIINRARASWPLVTRKRLYLELERQALYLNRVTREAPRSVTGIPGSLYPTLSISSRLESLRIIYRSRGLTVEEQVEIRGLIPYVSPHDLELLGAAGRGL